VFIYVFVRTITQKAADGLNDILHGPTQKPTYFSASCPPEWKAIFFTKNHLIMDMLGRKWQLTAMPAGPHQS